MAKRKNNVVQSLVADSYLLWAVIFTVAVGVGLLTQISLAKIQMDTEISSSLFLVNARHK